MRDPYPSLPAKDFRISRMLRVLVFSMVIAVLLVSLLVVSIQFIWDEMLAPLTGRAPYQPRVEFILPSMVLIGLVIAKLIWDAAEGGPRPPKQRGYKQ